MATSPPGLEAIRFPKLGASEGQVLRWFVKEGDIVMRDQLVAEIETEKVVAEMPSPFEGVVQSLAVEVGQTVPVGTVLIYVHSHVNVWKAEISLQNEKSQREVLNLMTLMPKEFEVLIAALFQSMGLETKLTQASHDGGIDCIAYDRRPVIGGEFIIQAKRYKHTVSVGVVRDLFGVVHDRRASKGILVTTSGYGNDAYKFAAGKPLELIDGKGLMHLLAAHMNINAVIEHVQ